jgi:nucleoside-diphosphate-sugar epimerase
MLLVMNNKLVVVVGAAGKLGRLVVEALLAQPNVLVRALVRDPSKPDIAAAKHDRLSWLAFDAVAASEAERQAAVQGAYAVVSTLQGGPDVLIDAQHKLLLAAKAAGARRFIPSDYSYNLFTLPAGININSDWRRSFADLAAKQTSPAFEVVHVLQGIFADRNVMGFLGMFDPQAGVVRYWGDGQVPIDWTSWEDTARFAAAAALADQALPSHLFVRGERMDIFTFAKTWEGVHGRALKLERLGSLEDLSAETRRRLAAEPQNMYAWLPLMYAQGVWGGQALLGESHNSLFPAITPESVAQTITRGAI